MEMEDETERLTDLLRGKTVRIVKRHRAQEVIIEFDDGTRLFIDANAGGLDLSVTSGPDALRDDWTVWRQDDNGNHFRVQSGLSHQEARSMAVELEKRGHKQFYWFKPTEA